MATETIEISKKKSVPKKKSIRENITGYLFLIPGFVPVALFIFIPLLFSFIVSIFINPRTPRILRDELVEYYSSVENFAKTNIGDFLYYLRLSEDTGQITDVFALILFMVFVAVAYISYNYLSKKELLFRKFRNSPIKSLAVSICFSIISPIIFNLFWVEILIRVFDLLYGSFGEILFLTNLPLKTYLDVVNSVRVDFFAILINTIVWTITCVFFHVLLGLLLALLMNRKFPARSFFRAIFILPWAIPQFVTALIWRNFIFNFQQGFLGRPFRYANESGNTLDPFIFNILDLFILLIEVTIWVSLIYIIFSFFKNKGLFKGAELFISFVITLPVIATILLLLPSSIYMLTNQVGLTSLFGFNIIHVPNFSSTFWITSDIFVFERKFASVLLSAIIINIWLGVPFMMVSFLAALQSIPQDLYEAAEIDGASKFAQFRTITFPLIKPTLFTVSLLGIVWTFNLFTVVYILSQNQNGLPPRNSWDIFVTYIYDFFNRQDQYAIAAALSFIVFIMLIAFSWAYRKVLSTDKIFEAEKPGA
ncbi:MAG: carbohydrate ABC transporter permease [Candidatus Hodarchaeales archaeon]